jgi:hypothetical protein
MIEVIQTEVKKIMYKCCERMATSKRVELEDVQLILGIDVDRMKNTYTITEKYDFTTALELDILQVLGVKIDFLNYSELAQPFIAKSLMRFAQEKNLNPNDTAIMCISTKDEKNKPEVQLFLYNGRTKEKALFVETLEFSDVFREEDIEMPT